MLDQPLCHKWWTTGVSTMKNSVSRLHARNAGFEERFSLLGGANLKTFEGSVPNEALGAGRVTIDIVDNPVEPKVAMTGLDKYWDREKKVLCASNGQIVWDYSERGSFAVDTPAAATGRCATLLRSKRTKAAFFCPCLRFSVPLPP